MKIGQAEITLVIERGKPFRLRAANALAARYTHAKSRWLRVELPDVVGQRAFDGAALNESVRQRLSARGPVCDTTQTSCGDGLLQNCDGLLQFVIEDSGDAAVMSSAVSLFSDAAGSDFRRRSGAPPKRPPTKNSIKTDDLPHAWLLGRVCRLCRKSKWPV